MPSIYSLFFVGTISAIFYLHPMLSYSLSSRDVSVQALSRAVRFLCMFLRPSTIRSRPMYSREFTCYFVWVDGWMDIPMVALYWIQDHHMWLFRLSGPFAMHRVLSV
ncbi:hypothetical protein BDV98DRAFT_566862 [Pterulicium gracile]|uniref:Uncharacterized protein n=1 Tax=Pterulicium gracile TaxID=1884261 RepID=A0A5C3QJT4_9AGAR|nr:hypothetical protein BDV98DRAFT_566862 [Pterula gracilis]